LPRVGFGFKRNNREKDYLQGGSSSLGFSIPVSLKPLISSKDMPIGISAHISRLMRCGFQCACSGVHGTAEIEVATWTTFKRYGFPAEQLFGRQYFCEGGASRVAGLELAGGDNRKRQLVRITSTLL